MWMSKEELKEDTTTEGSNPKKTIGDDIWAKGIWTEQTDADMSVKQMLQREHN